jgi:hypothetical protein
MKWLERLSNNFAKSLEAESQAYQAGFGAIGEAMEAVSEAEMRPVRSALGDSPEEFTSEDIVVPRASVLGMNMRNPQEEMPNQRIPKELVNAGFDMFFAPSNVLGAGLVTKGVRTVRDAAQDALDYFGPSAGRGGATASIPNYIDNYYGPTDPRSDRPIRSAIGTGTDKAVSAVSGVEPEKVRAFRQKALGLYNWGRRSVTESIEYVLDPQARATYKEMGITPGSQRHVARALADDAIHKATAQVQYTSHIGKQAGREGPVAREIQAIMNKSGVTDYFAYSDGSYAAAIKENKFYPTSGGRKSNMSASDLEYIEEHFGTVWRTPDPQGNRVKFKDDEGTILMIKAPGIGTQTGDHYNDIIKAGGYVGDLFKAFTKYDGKPSVEQLWKELKKVSDKNAEFNKLPKGERNGKTRWTLKDGSSTLEGAKENGIWLTNSKSGRAYTEGGINFIVKVQPNGNIFAVMSDEHNFLETIPAAIDKVARKVTGREEGASLIKQFEKVLPHRLVAVTPPMQANIFNLRSQLGKEGPKISNVKTGEGAVRREDLQAFVDARPSERGMLIEQQRNRGGAEILGGAGMFTLGGDNEEQR